jgi:hypothetical protein
MSREIDALIAEHVFGLAVQGEWLPAWAPEGDWSVRPEWRERGGVELHPVYVGSCMHEGYRDEMVARVRRLQAEHGWADAEVEKHIAKDDEEWACGHYWQCLEVVPHYSTDIAEAWRVVEKMREKGWDVMVDTTGYPGEEWRCLMWQGERERWIPAAAQSAPMAICLAALKANGIEVSAA